MGYLEALADGIRVRRTAQGSNGFYPPCCCCGKETLSWNYIRGRKYTCDACKAAAGISKLLRKNNPASST